MIRHKYVIKPFLRLSRPYNCCCIGESLEIKTIKYVIKKPSTKNFDKNGS